MPKVVAERIKLVPKKHFSGLLIPALLVIILVVTFVFWSSKNSQIDCTDEYRQDSIILSPNSDQIAVEIASDPVTQSKGLSGRECIADDWGMLFSFKTAGQYDFWMKDMKFSIDIVWMDENFKIISVDKNVKPETYPNTYTSSSPTKYVLELGANQAEKYGFTPGATVTF